MHDIMLVMMIHASKSCVDRRSLFYSGDLCMHKSVFLSLLQNTKACFLECKTMWNPCKRLPQFALDLVLPSIV